MNSYAKMVNALAKPGNDILRDLTPSEAHLWHMATGISGEAGEILDCVKKHVVYRKPLDRGNLIEELGDIEFFLEGLRQGTGITREECLIANAKKLAVRYAEGYTDRAAVIRADKHSDDKQGGEE
jgi:NTP pyrophosphatase (non-canonical NTP hydrolase)